jgi:hypothetical protein
MWRVEWNDKPHSIDGVVEVGPVDLGLVRLDL